MGFSWKKFGQNFRLMFCKKIISETKLIRANDEMLYAYLSDFSRFGQISQAPQVKNWQADSEGCCFTLDKIGDVEMNIVEKNPAKLIKIVSEARVLLNFTLWIQFKRSDAYATHLRITIKPKLNFFVRMLANRAIYKNINSFVNQIAGSFNH